MFISKFIHRGGQSGSRSGNSKQTCLEKHLFFIHIHTIFSYICMPTPIVIQVIDYFNHGMCFWDFLDIFFLPHVQHKYYILTRSHTLSSSSDLDNKISCKKETDVLFF